VFDSPDQHLTWVGFATFVTVMCGASLTLVDERRRLLPLHADAARHADRADASALLAPRVTTFVGGYAAVATGETNPFVAVVDLTVEAAAAPAAVAIVVQGIAANITNTLHAGLSLVNSMPRSAGCGRRARRRRRVALSAFPSFVDHAQRWITHLGNVAAPLTGVVLADYLLVQRTRHRRAGALRPDGRYRYLNGVNAAASARSRRGRASTTRCRSRG
jgi:purine-cytosine permease-like protein